MPVGNITNIEYKLSTDKTDLIINPYTYNAILPTNSNNQYISNTSPRNLVTKITSTDGRGSSYETSYTYYNGKTYTGIPPERKDLYFECVTQKDSTPRGTGTYTKTYYRHKHDSPYLDGRIERIESYAGNGALMKSEYYYYVIVPTSFTGTLFIAPSFIITDVFEMGTPLFTSTKIFQYNDGNGNVNTITEFDNRTGETIGTSISYNIDTTNWILNRPSEIKKTSNGQTLQWQKFNYIGNNLVSKEDYLVEESRWITTSFGYDPIGNVTSVTDALNQSTAIEYDSNYHTFITKSIKKVKQDDTTYLEQVTTRIYNPKWGVIKSETDPNNNTTTYEYDTFGRLTKIIEPGDVWTKQIFYNNIGDPYNQHIETQVKDSSFLGYHYSRSYFDGLNREYRTVSKAYHNGTDTGARSTLKSIILQANSGENRAPISHRPH